MPQEPEMAGNGRLGKFMTGTYAPLLVNKGIKALVMVAFATLLVRRVWLYSETIWLIFFVSYVCCVFYCQLLGSRFFFLIVLVSFFFVFFKGLFLFFCFPCIVVFASFTVSESPLYSSTFATTSQKRRPDVREYL